MAKMKKKKAKKRQRAAKKQRDEAKKTSAAEPASDTADNAVQNNRVVLDRGTMKQAKDCVHCGKVMTWRKSHCAARPV